MFHKKIIPVLFCLWAPLIHAEGFSTYFSLDSFAYSEPIAIKAIFDDWDAPLHTGEIAFAFARAEIGVGWNQWRLGVFRRYDYYYEFTPDTAYLKHSSENNLQLNTGEQLDIYLKANTIIANGLSLSHTLIMEDVSFGIRVSYLKGRNLTSGSLAGNAEVLAENDYDLVFDVDYYYSEDDLFDREVIAPEGDGYSIDINIDWNLGDNWNFNLTANDLLAKIFWKDAPRTIATGSTDTKEFDENGFVVFNPLISGLETYEDYTQTLPRRINFTTAYLFDKKSILFEIQDYEIKRFYSIGIGFNRNENESINLFYNYTASALKFYYHNQWLTFGVTSDELQLHKARTFALELSVTALF